MNLHFIHIGKTGGTAIQHALLDAGLSARAHWDEEAVAKVPETPFGRIMLHKQHSFRLRDLPPDDYAFFCLRDPISRFLSGFYSRLRKGLPRYYIEWTDKERATFEAFPTPQALAYGLASDDEEERRLAMWAMRNVRHLGSFKAYLGSRPQFRMKLRRIAYIARQETLATDWEQLKILLELPPEIELPSNAFVAHRRDPAEEEPLDERAVEILRNWYKRDYGLLGLCERVRTANGWGMLGVQPRNEVLALPDRDGRRTTSEPVQEPASPVSAEAIETIARETGRRVGLWTAFVNRIQARTVAEIGVYRGEFAEAVLDGCPSVERYYMIDPWRHLDDWNKPANRDDDTFQEIFEEAMAKTRAYEGKRIVLRGCTKDVIDQIPDGELEFAYVDGDHTLRGVTVDLVRVFPKLRDGGWIGGDDFSRSVWQHGARFEPTLVFPFAVHFAEAMDARIYALPHRQFLIEKRDGVGFEFLDLTGKYGRTDLLRQMRPRGGGNGAARKDSRMAARARALLRRARQRATR
jgi:Methyltransferase domain/Sulfotransferase family